MTRLIAVLIIASASVSAQKANPPAADERWEYCLAESTSGTDSAAGELVAKVSVCYATDQGCREDNFTDSAPVPADLLQRKPGPAKVEVFRRSMQAAAVLAARTEAKALAQLGKDRWELVSVGYPGSDVGEGRWKVLYFKRRVR